MFWTKNRAIFASQFQSRRLIQTAQLSSQTFQQLFFIYINSKLKVNNFESLSICSAIFCNNFMKTKIWRWLDVSSKNKNPFKVARKNSFSQNRFLKSGRRISCLESISATKTSQLILFLSRLTKIVQKTRFKTHVMSKN